MWLTLTSLLRIHGQPQNFGTNTYGCCILMVLFFILLTPHVFASVAFVYVFDFDQDKLSP